MSAKKAAVVRDYYVAVGQALSDALAKVEGADQLTVWDQLVIMSQMLGHAVGDNFSAKHREQALESVLQIVRAGCHDAATTPLAPGGSS
ncbi:hypothetical protein [Zavarzinia aquatilis]|uniref:Uncharacterized protein n=1 Tax=Zavarzinia aquatilis TaxID=2211142 RepID=A0A317DSL6_9PROT|nr:hypothetical protein [Zavarzinia aquatilis]PWR17667.1 hypothetical protein DKG74_20890 [Zavarzinia aquatilis]